MKNLSIGGGKRLWDETLGFQELDKFVLEIVNVKFQLKFRHFSELSGLSSKGENKLINRRNDFSSGKDILKLNL